MSATSTLPVLPTAAEMTVADVSQYGARIVAWAEQVNDAAEVKEAANKWAAITEYVRRTSREGVAEAEAALRRLESRIGQLLGPAEPLPGPGAGKPSVTNDGLSRNERRDFRDLAEHPDVVKEVIAESTDTDPPSRRKVLGRIRDTKPISVVESDEDRREREHIEAVGRRAKRLEMVASAWHEFRAFCIRDDYERDEVTARLVTSDLDILRRAQEEITWKNLNATVDELLDIHRPERYDIADRDWRSDVYAAIAPLIPLTTARQIAAAQLVDQREGIATRAANELLRRIGRTQQWPIDWLDVAHRPLSIGDERVQLHAAASDDLRRWAVDERRVAAQDFAARSAACDGAEWAADEMDANGWTTFAEALPDEADES